MPFVKEGDITPGAILIRKWIGGEHVILVVDAGSTYFTVVVSMIDDVVRATPPYMNISRLPAGASYNLETEHLLSQYEVLCPAGGIMARDPR